MYWLHATFFSVVGNFNLARAFVIHLNFNANAKAGNSFIFRAAARYLDLKLPFCTNKNMLFRCFRHPHNLTLSHK